MLTDWSPRVPQSGPPAHFSMSIDRLRGHALMSRTCCSSSRCAKPGGAHAVAQLVHPLGNPREDDEAGLQHIASVDCIGHKVGSLVGLVSAAVCAQTRSCFASVQSGQLVLGVPVPPVYVKSKQVSHDEVLQLVMQHLVRAVQGRKNGELKHSSFRTVEPDSEVRAKRPSACCPVYKLEIFA